VSTTVSDIIEEIQDRIPEERLPNLFPALNRAIRTIAKRLFALESDLVIAGMETSLFASVDYTALTIAFVSGGLETADTITDSASEFVAEGFEVDMPIKTSNTSNPGPMRITTVAADIINLDAKESVMTSVPAGTCVTITSVDDFGYLPDDFWGFIEKPYIDGYTWPLNPLPNPGTKLIYAATSGTPRYYELKGNRLYVTPGTGTDITIIGDYWQKPAKLTTMDDYLPWNELFDDAIEEYLSRVLIAGVAATDAELGKYLSGAVDLVVPKRSKKAPAQMPGGIRWN